MIIVNDKRLTDRAEYWSRLDDRLIRELSVTEALRTPANFIVHSLDEANGRLSQSEPLTGLPPLMRLNSGLRVRHISVKPIDDSAIADRVAATWRLQRLGEPSRGCM